MSTQKQDKASEEIEFSFLTLKLRFPHKDKLFRVLTAILYIVVIVFFVGVIALNIVKLFSG